MSRARRFAPHAVAAGLGALLLVLAWLQQRWIAEIADADRRRRRETLVSAGERLARDFDREITRAFVLFQSSPPAPGGEAVALAGLLDRWSSTSPYPGLVREMLLADPISGAVQRLDPGSRTLAAAAWPAGLEPLGRFGPERPGQGHRPILPGDVPALAVPIGPRRRMEGPGPGPPPGSEPPPLQPSGPRFVVLLLDMPTITGQLLPQLFTQAFGSGAQDWVASVVAAGRAGPVWVSDSRASASAGPVELTLPIFALRPFEELRGAAGPQGGPFGAGPPFLRGAGMRGAPGQPAWILRLSHRDGSLESAVARARRRNLAVGSGVLALLAASLALLGVVTRRERRLTAQQVAFVAGVSHEMNTPLAAIRSAAQNLADGVVKDPEQVRRYGGLLEAEGRRLSQLLSEALEIAGIQSGRKAYRRDAVEVASLVEAALADCAPLVAERTAAVERHLAPGLPPLRGDADALTRALRNLVENALKYGGDPAWVGIQATSGRGGVVIAVADHGAGVALEDRPHVFTPFYRGRGAGAAKGSGLGLAIVKEIVEAHGGRVTVEAGEGGRGSVFAMSVPAAREGEGERA